MSETDAITLWLAQLQEGDSSAPDRLFCAYFEKLLALARARLAALPRRSEDEEDVVLSAMNSFFRRASSGEFPALANRDDLWRLLVTITARKVVDRKRKHFAQKRVRPLDEAALAVDSMSGIHALEKVLDHEPSPDLATQLVEEFHLRLDQLPDDEFRRIALLKFEGYQNEEIAQRLGTYTRKIERRLQIIRSLWSEQEGEI